MSGAYEMTIAGLKRSLPFCRVTDDMDIAAFVIFGDVELTVAAAAELLKKCPDFDCIITAEAKGIPLAFEMARQSGKSYFVARKGVKLYMTTPISTTVRSITTEHVQTLFLDSNEADRMKEKNVLIVDDVISTGESLLAVKSLVKKAGGNIAGEAAILAEGEAANRKDIIFLEPLPLFFK